MTISTLSRDWVVTNFGKVKDFCAITFTFGQRDIWVGGEGMQKY